MRLLSLTLKQRKIMNNTAPLRSLIPVYAVIFIGFCGYSLLITILTPLIMHAQSSFLPANSSLAERTIMLGITLFLYPAGQAISSPIIGALTDRYGRKPVLLITLAAACVFYAGIALGITQQALWLVATCCFLSGLFEGNITIASSAIADLTTESNRQRYFGYLNFVASSAYIVAPLLGGSIAHLAGISIPFWLIAGLLLLTSGSVLCWFQEPSQTHRDTNISWLAAITNITQIFHAKHLRKTFLINFCMYMAIFGFFRTYPMYLVDRFHMQVLELSYFIAWVAVPILITGIYLTGYLSKYLSARSMVLLAAILLAASLWVITLPTSIAPQWVILFICGLGTGLGMPACAAYLSLQVPANAQGRALGNNQSLKVTAEALSGLFAGLLAAWFIALPLLALTGFAILAIILVLSTPTWRKLES
jgi:DHA1 family tetracycline resistance protein-like MFS transporter